MSVLDFFKVYLELRKECKEDYMKVGGIKKGKSL